MKEEARNAVELDPDFARGHMMLSWAHLYSYFGGWSDDPVAELEQGHAAAQHAISIDKDDFWGYAALAFAELFKLNHERALVSIDRAIALNPNSADNRAMRAVILNYTGDPELGLEEMKLAMRHNPNHPPWYFLGPGRALFTLGRYAEALPYIEQLVDAGDDILTWRSLLAACYQALGRHEEASNEIAKLIEKDMNISAVTALLPHTDQAAIDHYTALLRAAGLPE